MTNINRVTRYVMQHYPPANDWGADLTRKWISWHMNNQSCCVVKDDAGEIAGVGLARTVMKPEDGLETYAYDPEGSVHWVDLAVTTAPGAFTVLFLTMLKRYGRRDLIAYQRLPDPAVRVHRLREMRGHLLKKEFIYYGR